MAFSLCSSLCASVFAQNGGLSAWWVGSDYTNTSQTTAVSWTDRVSGISATAVAGAGIYPYLNAAGNAVTFTRSGSAVGSAGANFSSATNPIAGLTDFSVLVKFTPSAVGCSGNGNFYQDSGLVAAEQAGVTADWGLGYKSGKNVVAGYGTSVKDTTLNSSGTVEVGATAIAGMTVTGSQLNVWNNGVSQGTATVTNSARNNTPLLIGRMGADGGWYAGDIAEIRIFNHGLTASEMSVQTDIMANNLATYAWNGTTGNWGDSSWVKSDGTGTGTLAAGVHAFIESGSVTMANSPIVKSITVGNGLSTGTASLTATTATLAGAEKVILIAGGKLNYSNTVATNNIYIAGGTLSGVTSIASTTGIAELHIESGTFTTGGSFDVGGFNGTGSGKLTVSGGTVNMANSSNYFCVGNRSSGSAEVEQNGGTMNLGWITVGHKTVGTFNLNGGTLNIARMTLGEGTEGATTGNGTFNMKGGTLTSADEISVGTQSTGAFNLSNGSLKTTTLTLATASGSFNMKGGTLTATTANLNAGTFTYTAGTLAVNDLNVNSGATFDTKDTFQYGNSATVQRITMNGGSFTTTSADPNNPHRAMYIGTTSGGIGEFVMKSGTAVFGGDVNFGHAAGSTGTLKINGGSLSVNSLNVGRDGKGVMEMTSGTFSTNWYLSIADSAGSEGNVTVSGGSVTTPNLSVGNRALGTMTQTGGIVNATNTRVGESATGNGDLTVSGGILKTAQTLTVGAAGTGKMTISDNAYVQAETVKNAQNITFKGGNLITKNVVGNLTQTGGTLHVGGNISQGLDWARYKFTGLNDGFPGYTTENSSSWTHPTLTDAENFWTGVKEKTPAATGVGNLGDGQMANNSGPDIDYYSLIYNGMVYINKADDYTFSFSADDGGFIYVDGQLVSQMSSVNQAEPWGKASINTAINLTEGWHNFEYRYYEGWGGNSINSMTMTNSSGSVSLLNNSTQGVLLANMDSEIADMHINGNYTMGEEATLQMEVNAEIGTYDRLFVSGNADYSGNLVVDVFGDPTYTGAMNLLNAENGGTMNLDFSSITINSIFDQSYWDISGLLAGGNGVLSIRSDMVPEPSAWILFLLGASAMGLVRRFRKRNCCGCTDYAG